MRNEDEQLKQINLMHFLFIYNTHTSGNQAKILALHCDKIFIIQRLAQDYLSFPYSMSSVKEGVAQHTWNKMKEPM